MTRLQVLIEKRRAAKHQMMIARPLRGYLGNQYSYWEGEWNRARNGIEELKAEKSKTKKVKS